jgi:hypothetical protein
LFVFSLRSAPLNEFLIIAIDMAHAIRHGLAVARDGLLQQGYKVAWQYNDQTKANDDNLHFSA